MALRALFSSVHTSVGGTELSKSVTLHFTSSADVIEAATGATADLDAVDDAVGGCVDFVGKRYSSHSVGLRREAGPDIDRQGYRKNMLKLTQLTFRFKLAICTDTNSC